MISDMQAKVQADLVQQVIMKQREKLKKMKHDIFDLNNNEVDQIHHVSRRKSNRGILPK